MKYAVVYSSRTGNTRQLADEIHALLAGQDVVYFGEPSENALDAQYIYVGFWTDKGTCDENTTAFLKQITAQKIFLFGTAGFGGSEDYFAQIISRVAEQINPSAQVVGTYMCQGKMPEGVRRRYEAMPEGPKKQMLLHNFDEALSHPNEADLNRCRDAVLSAHSV